MASRVVTESYWTKEKADTAAANRGQRGYSERHLIHGPKAVPTKDGRTAWFITVQVYSG